jgi:hypothetical protein
MKHSKLLRRPESDRYGAGGLKGIYICITFYLVRRYGLNKTKGGVMKTLRLTVFLVMACTLVLLASQSAFGAMKIIKFNVPSCE